MQGGTTIMANPIHFLTPEGRSKLETELEHLRTVRRPQVAASLKSAIEEGDLTENAGYEESKREQGFVEGRIREIEAILANAEVLAHQTDRDVVSLGTRVTVAEEGGEPETYRIVGRAEADPSEGRISNESPLGKALLDHRVGDRLHVDAPDGATLFRVIAIE